MRIVILSIALLFGLSTIAKPQAAMAQPNNVGLNIGEQAPEIEMRSFKKKKRKKLSSLKKEIVLVDFWASWCQPCRFNHPQLVKLYETYNKADFKDAKGFEIFSVSLDTSKKSWKKAVAEDNLHWKNHVSDLYGWESLVALQYGLNAIPTNYLLDENGTIIARDVSLRDLDQILRSRLEL